MGDGVIKGGEVGHPSLQVVSCYVNFDKSYQQNVKRVEQKKVVTDSKVG